MILTQLLSKHIKFNILLCSGIPNSGYHYRYSCDTLFNLHMLKLINYYFLYMCMFYVLNFELLQDVYASLVSVKSCAQKVQESYYNETVI